MKQQTYTLPQVKQPPINVKRFLSLAKKVSESFRKEREWLEQDKRKHPDYYVNLDKYVIC